MIRRIIGAILVVVIFNALAMTIMAQLAPPLGLAWVVAVAAAFYAWSVRPGRRRRRRLATLRLRRPSGTPGMILLSAAATLMIMLAVGSFVSLIAPEIESTDMPEWLEMLQPYRESGIGRVALAALIAVAIPMVEEFSFRGRIQRLLERRYRTGTAIVVTALLFMTLHIGGPHWSLLSISLALGLMCGLAVHVFRSIWVPVLFHCLWNGSMLAAEGLVPAGEGTYPEMGTTGLAVTGVVLLALGLIAWGRVLGAAAAEERAPAPKTSPAGPGSEAPAAPPGT